MPTEPDNPMDDLLKAYAKKRRDDAGSPEMHPATRRLLQAEVAKSRPAAQSKPRRWFSPFLVYWPQLTGAASFAVVLVVGYQVLLREQEIPSAAERFAIQPASEKEVRQLDRLTRPAAAADAPFKSERADDKSSVALSFAEAQPPSLNDARQRRDLGTKSDEAVVESLAKAKASGGYREATELRQNAVPAPAEKPVLLTRNEPSAERDATSKKLALMPAAPPTPPPPNDPASALSPRPTPAPAPAAQGLPAVRFQADAFQGVLADEKATKPGSNEASPLGRETSVSSRTLNPPSSLRGVAQLSLSLTDPSSVPPQGLASGLAGSGLAAPAIQVPSLPGGPSDPKLVDLAVQNDSMTLGKNTTSAGATISSAPAAASGPEAVQAETRQQAYYRLAESTDRRLSANMRRQRFTRQAQPGTERKDALADGAGRLVLASFELRQEGNRLWAIDSDGSLYEGQLNATNGTAGQSVAFAVQPGQAPARSPAAGRPATTAAPGSQSGIRFRLAGTNQTLKQMVVFDGVLADGTMPSTVAGRIGTLDAAKDTPARGATGGFGADASGPSLALPIQGTLRIGNGNAVPVQAVPSSR